MIKVCSKCGVEKELGEFGKDSRVSSGKRSWCKVCVRQYTNAQRKRYIEERQQGGYTSPDSKLCKACGRVRSLHKFCKDKRSPDNRGTVCKACYNTYKRRWLAENPDKVQADRMRKKEQDAYRKSQLQRDYGITLAEYDAMFDAQGGVCAICGKPETATFRGTIKRLAVDHNHDTGEVRGLLCNKCNVGLGVLGDSSLRVMKAVMYLAEHGC